MGPRPRAETFSRKGDGVLPRRSFTVYIVDDDDSVRKALKRLLSASGYRVMTFESAEDFLFSHGVCSGGCIILDIRLPGMSGLDLCEKFVLSGANCPVIFITAQDNPQWLKRATATDAVAYLRKPFDQQVLLDALEAAGKRLEAAETDRRPG